MGNRLAYYALALRDRKRNLDILRSPEFRKERETATIIRLLQKGLCIENPRLGFGVAKLNKLFALCDSYAESFGNEEFCLKMARDVIKTYITFHREKGYESEAFAQICAAYEAFPCKETGEEEVFGGTLHIENKPVLSVEQLESFFASRHSIRDFEKKDISEETLLRAVRAAQMAPSACNRQAVRAYVLPSEKICELYENDLEGIGGFAQSANKFIFITGQLSAYADWEYNQHIVSASIFATYLMEALLALNIGACLVQRPLAYSKQWHRIAQKLGVPKDERLVLMMAVGYMKETCTVPVSKRLPVEQVVKFLEDK